MENLKYNQVIFKASSNCTKNRKALEEQLAFNPNVPDNCGCLSLEFRAWRHSTPFNPYKSIEPDFFTMSQFTTNGTSLSIHLKKLLEWHNATPNHYPVLINLDINSLNGIDANFHDEIDTYLKCYFGKELIFKPGQLIKNSSLSLAENVKNHGWPTLSQMRGKFIFCLTGNSDRKNKYANTDIEKRYCFSEGVIYTLKEIPEKGNIVFFSTIYAPYQPYKELFRKKLDYYHDANYITRLYNVNSSDGWEYAISHNFSVIATDRLNASGDAEISPLAPLRRKAITVKGYLKNKANNEYRTNKASKMCRRFKNEVCTFIFEKHGKGFALKNEETQEYLNSKMNYIPLAGYTEDELWVAIRAEGEENGYYFKNIKNSKYLTKKASKLSDSQGDTEIFLTGIALE